MKVNKYNLKIFLLIILNFEYRNCTTKTEISRRVVGGRLAEKNEFVYVVRLDYQKDEFKGNQSFETYIGFCTGSALSPSWVLTAAHCTAHEKNEKKHETFYVRYNHFFPEVFGRLSKVLRIYEQEEHRTQVFHGFFMRNDVSLLKTDVILVSNYAKLSALDYTTLYGHQAIAVGHGITNITDDKLKVPLQVLTVMINKCTHDRNKGFYVLGGFCLYAPCGVVASGTRGDSGGPVVHSLGVIGVISAGAITYNKIDKELIFLHFKASSGLMTSVSPVLDWILYIINNHDQ